ncbi:TIM44-like domain-containing protein [Melittangium boletus]|uniref:TIM44-like domain-containing protein n=1 Tax=Melittangium boletus TaxID=83453 RepID=UPI003DA46C02
MRTSFNRLVSWTPWLLGGLGLVPLLLPLVAEARGGGGEHYSSGRDRDSGGGGGALPIELVYWLVRLVIYYPHIMLPLVGAGAVAWYFYRKNLHPTGATQRALDQRDAELQTVVSARDVDGWVQALQRADPQFQLEPLLDRTRRLFLAVQDAWFKRDMAPVRPFLSDATSQRFGVQLRLMRAQGVRDALTDIQVLDVGLIGLERSEWFDTVHLRVRARMRDTDVSATASDAEALQAARSARMETFTEVWSFVRKPGVGTRIGADLFQGKCPNCGAPYDGGASNQCGYCQAIVNSGNYDWTLSEITQGVEYTRHALHVDRLDEAREADPALNLEILEDRTSLLFWKWVDAQSRASTQGLHKVATPDFIAGLDEEQARLRERQLRRVFLECAVGGVIVRGFEREPNGFDRVHVEVRWSARTGQGPANETPPALPTVPQRWVFTLRRQHGATTNTSNGMSTDRCAQCNAPLTDSAATTCDFCGTRLGTGERDWVLVSAEPVESWRAGARPAARRPAPSTRPLAPPPVAAHEAPPAAVRGEDIRGDDVRGDDVIADPQERQRLLFMMAALATADGQVDAAERKLLEDCARRWSVPWSQVQMAINTGPSLFTKLVQRGTPAAEVFLSRLVEMALVDGRIDRKERRMLEFAAAHLGLEAKLSQLLAGR